MGGVTGTVSTPRQGDTVGHVKTIFVGLQVIRPRKLDYLPPPCHEKDWKNGKLLEFYKCSTLEMQQCAHSLFRFTSHWNTVPIAELSGWC